MNEAVRTPQINRQMAQAYLMASDPESLDRTCQTVMEAKLKSVVGPTRSRWETAIRDKAFDLIRTRKLIETRPEDFRATLNAGRVATNVFLRKLHNLALDMNWLLGPVLVKPQWPKVQYASKRAITEAEQRSICGREGNAERRAIYELCWHLGGSQGDIASLGAEDIDWNQRTVAYRHHKTGEHAEIQIGQELEVILHGLPSAGPLLPYLRTVRAGDPATEFKQRCKDSGSRASPSTAIATHGHSEPKQWATQSASPNKLLATAVRR